MREQLNHALHLVGKARELSAKQNDCPWLSHFERPKAYIQLHRASVYVTDERLYVTLFC